MMKKHALVVDDNLLVLTVVGDMLEQMGFQTYRARDGTEAISLLGMALPIALVVTDVLMHDVSGLDVFHAARRRSKWMPVVFVTAYPADLLTDIQNSARVRVVDKPFSFDDLQSAVQTVMA
jgi:CheY-like chemotaxis protein